MGGDTFLYGLIVVILTYITHRIKPSHGALVGTLLGLVTVYILQRGRLYREDQKRDRLNRVRNSPYLTGAQIQKSAALYDDEGLLLFLDEYRDYYQYNPALYLELVKVLNDFVNTTHQISTPEGPSEPNLLYENLQELRIEIMNIYQSAAHTVPLDKRFGDGATQLEQMLNHRIDVANRYVIGKNIKTGPTTFMKFPIKNTPRGIEAASALVSRDQHLMY